jgi:hypothetical protein
LLNQGKLTTFLNLDMNNKVGKDRNITSKKLAVQGTDVPATMVTESEVDTEKIPKVI